MQQVKNNCGFQDDNQARMYTQQATGLLRENANNDPQGVSSLLATSWEEVEEQEYSS